MPRRDWTFWIVSEDQTGLRHYRLPRDLVRLGIAAVLLVVAFLGSAANQLFHAAESSIEERHLSRRSALLEAELDNLRSHIDTLSSSLNVLHDSETRFRLLAGMEPFDDAMHRVGIVGPGTETVTDNPLFAEDPAPADRAFIASSQVDELLRRARLIAFSWREAGDALKRRYDDLASTPSILPTAGFITSVFSKSRWHPILGKARPHLGVDIVAPIGTPVVAAARGRVAFVGRRGEYGLMIEVDHGYGRITRYAHLSRAAVHFGQRVERGDIVGKVGSSGLAVGPHLHYEVLINGRPANPRTYILETSAIPD